MEAPSSGNGEGRVPPQAARRCFPSPARAESHARSGHPQGNRGLVAPPAPESLKPGRQGRYVHAATDLNGDGRDEMFTCLMGFPFCGTGGCTLQLYQASGKGYELLSFFPASHLPTVASDRHHDGWPNLWQLQSGGGAPAAWTRQRFNGETYLESSASLQERLGRRGSSC